MPKKLLVGGLQRNGTLRGSVIKKVSTPIVPLGGGGALEGYKSPAHHRHSGGSYASSGYGSQTSGTIDRNSICSIARNGNDEAISPMPLPMPLMVTNGIMSGVSNSPLKRGDYHGNGNNNGTITNRPSQLLPQTQPGTGKPLTSLTLYPPESNTHYAQVIVHHPRPSNNNNNINNHMNNINHVNNNNLSQPVTPTDAFPLPPTPHPVPSAHHPIGFIGPNFEGKTFSVQQTQGIQSNMGSTATATAKAITVTTSEVTHKSQSRASLEDQGIEVGRESPSGSSSSSGTSSCTSSCASGSRHSTASLDSGRVSGTDVKQTIQLHRLSVHSCESVGSSSGNSRGISGHNSSSSSSIGSGTGSSLTTDGGDQSSLNTPTSGSFTSGANVLNVVNVAEMVLHGLPDAEILGAWLGSIHFEEYTTLFIQAGYDMPTISRMTPEDLTAIGITKPAHRRKLKAEIQRLNIADGIPSYRPDSLGEWLKLLRLEEYLDILCQQGYDSIDRVTELTWEDLEEIGVKKLGHQKRLMLAIKRIRDMSNGVRRSSQVYPNGANGSSGPSSSSLSSTASCNSVGSCPDVTRPSLSSYRMPLPLPLAPHSPSFHSQQVAITTSNRSKGSTSSPSTEVPTSPELKTFQPSEGVNKPMGHQPMDGFLMTRQMSEGPFIGLMQSSGQSFVFQTSRGRSLESLDQQEEVRFGKMMGYSHRVPVHVQNQLQNQFQNQNQNQNQNQLQTQNQNQNQYNPHQHQHQHQQHPRPMNSIQEHSSWRSAGGGSNGYETDSGLVTNSNRDNYKGQGQGQEMYYVYEVEGTATLHRPKGLIKAKPIAKIAAKSRQAENSSSFESIHEMKQKNSSTISLDEKGSSKGPMGWATNGCEAPGGRLNSSYRDSPSAAQIYATLKRKKTPPPPPKRTNSMKSGSSGCYILSAINDRADQPHLPARCSSLEAMQEQAFATCVKSLASRFSIVTPEEGPPLPTRNHSVTPRVPSPLHGSDNEFPPPPSPLPFCALEESDYERPPSASMLGPTFNTLPRRPHNRDRQDEANISSSSSTESMPFANDNVGTIKQRVNNPSTATTPVKQQPPLLESVMSAPASVATSPSATLIRRPKNNYHANGSLNGADPNFPSNALAGSKSFQKKVHNSPQNAGNNGNGNSLHPIEAHRPLLSPTSLSFQSDERKEIPEHSPTSSPTKSSTGDVIDDIETMLTNLSNQLDAMLENEINGD